MKDLVTLIMYATFLIFNGIATVGSSLLSVIDDKYHNFIYLAYVNFAIVILCLYCLFKVERKITKQ